MLSAAAEAVIEANQGKRVETCFDKDSDELLACVIRNTNTSAELLKLSRDSKISSPQKFSYFDDSGDCTLQVLVVPADQSAALIGNWICD